MQCAPSVAEQKFFANVQYLLTYKTDNRHTHSLTPQHSSLDQKMPENAFFSFDNWLDKQPIGQPVVSCKHGIMKRLLNILEGEK